MKRINSTKIQILVITTVMAALAGCAGGADPRIDVTSGPSPAAIGAGSIQYSVPPIEGAPRVLVVYFSEGGATERIARDLADLSGADLEEIREHKDRKAPLGFLGYFGAGARATFRTAPRIQTPARNPADYDAVFVCTPVISWSLSPPVRSWLRTFHGTLPATAYVTVSGDTRPDKIVRNMVRESGQEPFAFAGFSERDQYVENRDAYVTKIAALVDPLRVKP
ncbi:MAG: hypothetical protein ABIJ86_12235 [Spirochaetota bacterium]